jgi:hypothetical protein
VCVGWGWWGDGQRRGLCRDGGLGVGFVCVLVFVVFVFFFFGGGGGGGGRVGTTCKLG